MNNQQNKIPMHLSHTPIISVDYSEKDAYAGDAKFLSIGRATWNKDDISAKIWRWAEDGERWSRQSEEMPLWRILDLAKFLIAAITGQKSTLNESHVNDADMEFFKNYIDENLELYSPRLKEIFELLNDSNKVKISTKAPNIFSFATSELSQDAILSWLIKWADDKYLNVDRNLCYLGKSFLTLLTNIPQTNIHTVEVGRQWCNIDIWAEINDDAFLVIEDKTSTTVHGNQLQRYKEAVEEEYDNQRNHLFFTYVKTGNESLSISKSIQAQGYKTINRSDILAVLNTYKGKNPLVIDFYNHLQELENATNSYKLKPIKEWKWYEWQGFYMELEKQLDVENWDYVANPAGGFIGLWWNFIENEEIRMYLQFEESKLCFKIEYEGDSNNRSKIRAKYHSILMDVAKAEGTTVERPSRFGAGTYMTIGIISPENIFGDGIVNIDSLVNKLKHYEDIVKKCME